MHPQLQNLVMNSLLKTRWLSEQEFWERYEKRCERQRVAPLLGQARTAIRCLRAAGYIVVRKGKAKRAR